MKIGIGSYALTWAIGVPGWEQPAQPLDAFDLVELAATLGCPLVQLADNVPLTGLDTKTIAVIANKARNAGIRLETGTRGTDPALLLHHLELATRLGARLVRTLALEEDLTHIFEQLSAVLPQYAGKGVSLALENHGLHTADALAGLLRKLRSTSPAAAPFIGCCLDTVNSFGALEGPATVIAQLAPLTLCLHLKDFIIRRHPHQMGFEIIGSPAGTGRLDIPSLLRTVMEHAAMQGRDVPGIVLEQWVPWQGDIERTVRVEREWLDESLHNFNDLVLPDVTSRPDQNQEQGADR